MGKKRLKTADEFFKSHFNGIEKYTWYFVLVALAEGYAKYKLKQIKRV